MVQMYTIAGRQVGSHVLSMATLGTAAFTFWAFSGGKKQEQGQGPPINAKSKDEESFITNFMESAEKDGKQKQ